MMVTKSLYVAVNIFFAVSLVWAVKSAGSACTNPRIHDAIRSKKIDLVKEYIRAGDNIYSKDCSGSTPILLAALSFYEDGVYALLEGKLDLLAKDELGNTVLFDLVRAGKSGFIKNLVELGCTVDHTNSNGSTPLFEAVLSGNSAAVDVLLKLGADPTFRLPGRNTYLHKVLETNDFRKILTVMDLRLSREPINENGDTPLKIAVEMDHPALVNLLLSKGADIAHRFKGGQTYLHVAVAKNCTKVIRTLALRGIRLDSKNNMDETPMSSAVKSNNSVILQELIQLKSNLKEQTYLHDAVDANFTDGIILLAKAGLDLNVKNAEGYTPTASAFKSRKFHIVKLLVELGSRFDLPNFNGSIFSQYDIGHFRDLFESGVNPDIRDSKGNSLMYAAVQEDNVPMMDVLKSFGSDLNQTANACYDLLSRISYGYTVDTNYCKGNISLLHVAAAKGSLGSIMWLVEAGIPVNRTSSGVTPLRVAVGACKRDSVALLLELGACDDFYSSRCQEAYEYARDQDQKVIAKLILERKSK